MDLVSSTYARSVFLSIPILSLEDTFIYGLKPSKLLSLAFVPWLETNVYKMSFLPITEFSMQHDMS